MKHIWKAMLTLGRRGQHNYVKILCLAVSIAAGAVLIGKVGYEKSYDDFFPTSHRIYVVSETIVRGGEYKEHPQCAGAIGPGLARYCPQVEAATRFTGVLSDYRIVTDDDRRLRANVTLVDSCFFDVFPFQVLEGDPHDVLSRTGYCMLPRSLAEKLGGDVVGMKLYANSKEGLPITVGGIYEDIPLNSKMNDMQVMLSMCTIAQVTWDGRDNWVGNDRYQTYVRLADGVDPGELRPLWQKMMQENVDMQELSEAGLELGFSFTPITQFNVRSPEARRMLWILSLLAAVLIFCAVMNYLLIVFGGMVGRAKEMAVHKCYGAGRHHIYAMVMAEAVVHLLLAAGLAAVLLLLCRTTIEHLTGAPLPMLLRQPLIGGCLLVVLAVTGLVPAWLYARVPVAVAFRSYRESHRRWKLVLLAMQFASATFLVALVAVINKQYRLMVNDDPGYEYRDLAIYDRRELTPQERQLLIGELRRLPAVESVTTSTAVLTEFQSGDNITLPDDPREYMNVADLYFTGDGYFTTMGIPLVAGRTFTEGTDTLCEMMVSRRFDERMTRLTGWDTSIGKQVHCSSFNQLHTIVGIYEDVRMGSIATPDDRPSVMFYRKSADGAMPVVLVRFHHKTTDAIAEANARIQELLPGKDVVLEPYTNLMLNLYADCAGFRTTVGIGGMVALLIALIGLTGYVVAEVQRRQKEVAIRKVNGARTRQVLRLFVADILRVALPAVAVGGVGAYAVATLWQQQFSEKAAPGLLLFVGCGVVVVAVIMAVVALNSWRVANGNPVDYIKSE